MSCDGYVVNDDLFFAAALVYIHSAPDARDEVTRRIELLDDRGYRKAITLDVASFDAESYFGEYMSGTLAIADLKNFGKRYSRLTFLCKDLQHSGERVWEAPRSDAWWSTARQAVLQRQRERDRRN